MSWNSTLKRHKPLRRGFIKRKTAIKKVSDKQKGRLRKYYPVRNEFLDRPENRFCMICICVSTGICLHTIKQIALHPNMEDEFIKLGATLNLSSEVHHVLYRAGDKLFDAKGFCPSCRKCRDVPHEHPKLARSLGLLK